MQKVNHAFPDLTSSESTSGEIVEALADVGGGCNVRAKKISYFAKDSTLVTAVVGITPSRQSELFFVLSTKSLDHPGPASFILRSNR